MGQAHIPACAPPGHSFCAAGQPAAAGSFPGVLTPLSSHLRRLTRSSHSRFTPPRLRRPPRPPRVCVCYGPTGRGTRTGH
eukprot:2255938-Prymnesium_polylepis.1